MDRQAIFDYVKEKYGTEPEYLWMKYPTYAVLRHSGNRKWYAAVMNVARDKLGLHGGGSIEIIDLKCEPMMIDALCQTAGFLPGYHMNKKSWITILLDGTVEDEKILDFIDWSYSITGTGKKKR